MAFRLFRRRREVLGDGSRREVYDHAWFVTVVQDWTASFFDARIKKPKELHP